jgi:seryl-tRNA synthetase
MSVGVQRLRDEPDVIRKGSLHKGEDPELVDRALEIDAERRRVQADADGLRAELKRRSAEVAQAMKAGTDAEPLREQARSLGEAIREREATLARLEADLEDLLLRIPNPADPDVPVGGEEANLTVRTWGEVLPRDHRKPHWDVAEELGIIDHTREHGFTEVWPPAVVNADSARGTGQIPDKEDQMYVVTRDDLYLVPTAEVPVTNLHRDEILDADRLPIRYAAYSPCFRREAGAAGKDTRGILRVHQFDKVEMVLFERPADSNDALEWMTARAEVLLQRLGLAYRVLLMSTREMGFVQAKKYDLEVWAPGVERWLEVSSCSNFRDYQARRMAIRWRPEPGAKPELVHTLNGSGLALARTVAALLETYQEPDGTVAVPDILRPYLGGLDRIGRQTGTIPLRV